MEESNVSVLVQETAPAELVQKLSGFNEETVRAHSAARNEPQWMLERRLAAWQLFTEMPWPAPTDESWRRTRLTGFDLKKFAPLSTANNDTEAVGQLVQNELDEMESAASLVFQSGTVVHHHAGDELAAKGVIFTDLQSACRQHPEIIQQYFMTSVVKPEHNKFTALHAALWDTGALIYVPKNTKIALPLQVILDQNQSATGGYHHTLLSPRVVPK
jgi:Fe-S cluster assembly scaffold protein SufB